MCPTANWVWKICWKPSGPTERPATDHPCRFRVHVSGGSGADRIRTDDLIIANDALYQLSYRPDQALASRSIIDRPFAFAKGAGGSIADG